jgi:eukaryotic-like serine/threonine-protein kinase
MKLGAFEILHELKQGGMGSVLLGRRKGPGSFEQLVAIKTIRPEYAQTEAVRAMFLDEAKILGGLTHPNIATVHDFGEDSGTLYMAMEYVAGTSFRALTDLDPSPGVIARAIAEACRGLHAAHEVRDVQGNLLNVVHRDISPDNLMLGYDGHVKVIDFGIALVKNRQAPVTEFGTVKGKPPYMSPEQVKNEGLDRRSDVFSLAVVMHELLTGEPLFDGDNIYAVALAVESKPLLPPSQVLGRPLPPGLDAVVMRALDRDLAHRTPTAAAFAEQLEQVIASAGDETLEAWSERTLSGIRDQHRAWLASVITGHDTPMPIGRATGSVTAIGPLANLTSLPAAAPPTPLPGERLPPADVDTHLPALTEQSQLPRRSLGRALVWLALVLVAAVAVVIVVMSRSPSRTTPDAAIVAIADAAPIDADLPIDAAPDAAIDAAPPDGAVVVVADAKKVARDAAAIAIDAPAPPDAPVVDTGTGGLIVKHHPSSPSYLDVFVDGKPFGKTPIVKPRKLSAGPHVVTLARPENGEVVHRATITIVDGQTTSVVQPAP